VTLQDLHKIARQSIGRDRSTKDVDDWTKEVWGNVASPGVRCEKKRKEREIGWTEKLGVVDGKTKNKKLKGLDSSPCPSPLRDNDRGPRATTNVVDRPALGLKQLGPMFNLAESMPTPPPSNPGRGSPRRAVLENKDPPSPLRRRLAKPRAPPSSALSPSNALPRRTSGPRDILRKKDKLSFAEKLMPPIPISTPPARRIESQLPTPPSSTDSNRNAYASKPMIRFLRDAFVWFAQPCNAPRPAWRPPTKDLLVGATQLHSLESLLAGCGWQVNGTASNRMKYGVVFVDDSSTHGKSWKEYASKTLQERHALLTSDARRNQVWVFDVKLLGFDALETTEGEVEQLAIWRFD